MKGNKEIKMEKELVFPKNFRWGSATSAEQSEPSNIASRGGKSTTIWEQQYIENSGRFFDLEFSQNNFYEKYKSDLKIAKDLNFNSLRTSISWARLIPNGVDTNEKAVEFYRDVFKTMKENGLEVFVGLYHFDMPLWAQEKGGWTSREVVDKFAHYSKIAFEKFGDLVDRWATFNEPVVYVEGQYWYDFHYPNKVDFKEGIKAAWLLNVAHAKVIKEFRKKDLNSKIGTILNITPASPRSNNPADLKAAKYAELFQWRLFTEPMLGNGFPNELIDLLNLKKLWISDFITKEDEDLFASTNVDFVGINYYSPLRVKSLDYVADFSSDSAVTPHTHFYNVYEMPGRRMNPYRGWEIHPKSIYKMLKTIKEEYNNIPVYISENGMGVQDEEKYREKGIIQDKYRIDFITEHLYWVHKAIEEGVNCFGYHMWTYIDNWSWMNAYKNRYGFIELDLKTNERKEKLSASWIRKVIKNNSLVVNEDKIPKR